MSQSIGRAGWLLLLSFWLLVPAARAQPAASTTTAPSINRIYFRGTPGEIQEIQSLLLRADQLPSQVLLELYLLDVNVTDNTDAGVNLEFFFGPERPFAGTPLGAYTSNQALTQASQTIRYGSLSTEKFRLFFNYLKNKTSTRILARPSLMVLNGQTAQVNLGGRRRFVTGASTQQTQGAQSSSLETEELPIGQNVAVNPRILPNDLVLLGLNFLDQQVASVDTFSSTIGNIQLPQTSSRSLSTALLVKDGEAVVIGGLRLTTDREFESRLPFLSSLPFIGRNFGNFTDSADSRELVVVIKVTILRPEDMGMPSGTGAATELVPVVVGPPVESSPAGG